MGRVISILAKPSIAPSHFERVALPHLNAAYNLARWLTRNDHDAEDVVQEAYLRAFKFFGGFHGKDGRPWLLTIVRHTCYTWLTQNRPVEVVAPLDEEETEAGTDLPGAYAGSATDPEAMASLNADKKLLNRAIAELPVAYREVLILRELEDFSYKQIAVISGAPIGTIMSRLARARRLLRQSLAGIDGGSSG